MFVFLFSFFLCSLDDTTHCSWLKVLPKEILIPKCRRLGAMICIYTYVRFPTDLIAPLQHYVQLLWSLPSSLWHTLSQFPSPHPTTLPDNDFLSVFRNWVTNHIPCSGVIQNACMSLLPELDSCHGNIMLACLNWANFIMYNILFYIIYYSCVCTHIQYADR